MQSGDQIPRILRFATILDPQEEETLMNALLSAMILLTSLILPVQVAPEDTPEPADAVEQPAPIASPIDLLGKEAPAMVLPDLEGNSFDLTSWSDQVVVLEWSLPGCRFTQRLYLQKRILPMIRRWKKKDIRWVTINSAFYAHPIKIQPWIEKYPITHPYLLDKDGKVSEAFGVTNCPTFLVIDHGKVVYYGAIDDDVWGRNLERVNYLDDAIRQVHEGEQVSNALTRPYGMSIRTRRSEDERRATIEKARLEREKKQSESGSTDGKNR